MKLRIRGNSVRIRLDTRDLVKLVTQGHTGDELRFGSRADQNLSYSVRIGTAPHNQPQMEYVAGRLTVTISRQDAEEWSLTDRVGFNHQQHTSDGETVRLLLEKDFACIDRAPGEEPDDAFAFPNPTADAC